MYIKSLSTYNFRNLEDQSIFLCPSVNFIIGRNGQGKTNFIESISLLSRGKSFRTNKNKEFIKIGAKEASIFSSVFEKDNEFSLGISLIEEGKEYFYNQDKVSSLKEYIGRLISITFSPDDLDLIKGGPQARRNFIDKHILDIKAGYLDLLFDYQRALKNKNRIIKTSAVIYKKEITPWNLILCESGSKIMKERAQFINLISPLADKYYKMFTEQEEKISLTMKNTKLNYSEIGEENFYQALESNYEKEISLKSSTVGVHRDEIEIKLSSRDSRIFASQGETRSLVLALKLAVLDIIEAEKNTRPVLLLDDVDSELDAFRRNALMDIVFSKDRQIIITGTQLGEFKQKNSLKFQVFRVCNGQVLREEFRD